MPTLHYKNIQKYPEWASYIQKVYHEGIHKTHVPLQSFTWFYNNAPFQHTLQMRTQNLFIAWEDHSDFNDNVWLGDIALTYNTFGNTSKHKLKLKENDVYVGLFKTILSSALLRRATNYGFFVKHKSFNMSYIQQQLFIKKRIEVLHVLEGQELPFTWFWLVRGSGVFVDVSFAKTIKVYTSRAECKLYAHAKTQSDIDYIDMHKLQTYMKKKNIDIVVFFEANGVPEMVLRHSRVQNTQTMSMPQDFFIQVLMGNSFYIATQIYRFHSHILHHTNNHRYGSLNKNMHFIKV